jgi:arylsulfatase A-like enzyme
MALHNTHAPFEVPELYASLYNYSFTLQKTWAGMVSMVDETVKNVTTELKAQKMWENTLLIMAGDNGSPVCGWGAAGSNAPLREFTSKRFKSFRLLGLC